MKHFTDNKMNPRQYWQKKTEKKKKLALRRRGKLLSGV
jgi:hypothetical protein